MAHIYSDRASQNGYSDFETVLVICNRTTVSVGFNLSKYYCFYFVSLMSSKMSKIVFWKNIASLSKEPIGPIDYGKDSSK